MPGNPTRPFPFDVFLSHSSKDKPHVRVLAKQLRDQEGLRCWYDEWNLQPGLPWQEALEQGLADSASITVFIGPEKLGPWHNEELREAINRSVSSNDGFRVIPALLPGADPDTLPTFLKRMMWVDFREGIDDELAYKKLTAAIRGEAFEESAFSLPETLKPFVGVAPYTSEDRQYFFGRVQESTALVKLIRHQSSCLLFGGSGYGKTSIVQASLLPLLKEGNPGQHWSVRTLRPGSDPFLSLANLVVGLEPDPEDQFEFVKKARELAAWMKKSDTALRDAVSVYFETDRRTLFLVIDQLEEVFLNFREAFPDEYETLLTCFARNLSEAHRLSDGRFRLLLVLRSDFSQHFISHPIFSQLVPPSARVQLSALGEEAIRTFIQQSAFTAGAFFEKGLVNSLMKEVEGQAGKLSWLQVQMERLWEGRKGSWLTVEAFEQGGGLGQVICEEANQFRESLSEAELGGPFQIAMMRLVEPGEGTSDRRQSVPLSHLLTPPLRKIGMERVLYRMTAAPYRLAETDGEQILLAHDALVRIWEPTLEFLKERREEVRVLARMSRQALEWQQRKSGKGQEFLFKGVMLEEFEQLEARPDGIARPQLPPHEAAFVRASVRERRLKKRRSRIVLGVISAAMVVAVVFMVFAIQAEQQAEQNLELAVQSHNQFLEEQAEKVRNSVEDIIGRAEQLAEREGDYDNQRLYLLQQAQHELEAYSDNEKLAPMVAALDSMINNFSLP